jgi:hypothetical protein
LFAIKLAHITRTHYFFAYRRLNVGQVPIMKPVLCRILANAKERAALAERFDMSGLVYFGANVTVSWRESTVLLVQGNLEAHMGASNIDGVEVIVSEFDTTVLNNFGSSTPVSLSDDTDFDSETDADGNVDIGEIAAQYLALEL